MPAHAVAAGLALHRFQSVIRGTGWNRFGTALEPVWNQAVGGPTRWKGAMIRPNEPIPDYGRAVTASSHVTTARHHHPGRDATSHPQASRQSPIVAAHRARLRGARNPAAPAACESGLQRLRRAPAHAVAQSRIHDVKERYANTASVYTLIVCQYQAGLFTRRRFIFTLRRRPDGGSSHRIPPPAGPRQGPREGRIDRRRPHAMALPAPGSADPPALGAHGVPLPGICQPRPIANGVAGRDLPRRNVQSSPTPAGSEADECA
jgi:hypothetical protein